jgi:hypothetical protein
MTPKKILPPSSLCAKTLELLRSRDKSVKLLDICIDTGIGFWWIRTFLDGRIANPGCNNVQALYEYLTKKTLDV